MPLPIKPVLGILADNLARRGSVLPISKRAATRWAKGLNLPKGGETVLYTGHMYQLIPAIDAMAKQMAVLENSPITKFFGLGRFFNKFINLSFFMSLTASKKMKRENDTILRNIATLLKDAGVAFGYLYGEELYSGALVYDLGLDEIFVSHARKVAQVFKRNGVKRVITTDPHTTNMLRHVFPEVLDGFDVEVKSYLEVLAEVAGDEDTPAARENGKVVIHDSCVYARYEDMTKPPRELLARKGVAFCQPELSAKATHCCGGPIESLFPSESHRIATARIEQLAAEGDHVVSMCPICLVNLRKAAEDRIDISDIASVLASK